MPSSQLSLPAREDPSHALVPISLAEEGQIGGVIFAPAIDEFERVRKTASLLEENLLML